MEYITDNEAEDRTISAMLHSEPAVIECLTIIEQENFHKPLNRDIFGIIKSLYSRGTVPTYVEVIKEGMTMGLIKTAADAEEIQHIAGKHIADRNAGYWADKVKAAAKGRQAQQLLAKCAEKIAQSRDIGQFIRDAGADWNALAMEAQHETIETAADVAKLGEQLVTENCAKWRNLQEEMRVFGETPLEGVSTGMEKLNDLTLGYKPGDLVILGAQTGHGKTAMALNTALASCVDGNRPLLYINTEMSRKQIAYRWAAILSEIPLQRIRTGNLRDAEIESVTAALQSFSLANFYTSYIPNLTPEKLQALARKAKLQHNIEMLIIDYVGRLDTSDPRDPEWLVLYNIVKSQKMLAQNLDVACMVLVQLNADGSLQGAKRMKNECDLMLKLLPLCEDLLDEEQRSKAQEKIEKKYNVHYEPFTYYLWVDKSRDSEAGISIPLVFDKSTQQIREAKEV